MGFFLPSDKLHNLKLYKYSAEDHSVISKKVLKKWWNTFVQIFPLWMAPNAITLLGLVWIMLNLACVFYYDPYLNTESPRWCYFFYALGLFMYQTFDGCDGCHARRTGQSGPLGELFDHSIDAINTTLGSIVFSSTLQFGYGRLLLLAQFASVCNFYMSTWEEYHTSTLFLSLFSGPVEGILMVCGVYVLTGVFGPGIFTIRLFEFSLDNALLQGHYVVDVKTAASILGLVSLYFNIAQAASNVSKFYKKNSSDYTAKVRAAYRGLLPFVAYYFSIFVLVASYPEYLYDFGLGLLLSVGLSIAFSVGRIILAHLTKQEFPMVNFPMFVPTLQLLVTKVLTGVFHYDTYEVISAVAWVGLGLTLGIHAMFVNEIIYEITAYLDIYALSIKHKKVN